MTVEAPQPKGKSIREHLPFLNQGVKDEKARHHAGSIAEKIEPELRDKGFKVIEHTGGAAYEQTTVLFYRKGDKKFLVTLVERGNKAPRRDDFEISDSPEPQVKRSLKLRKQYSQKGRADSESEVVRDQDFFVGIGSKPQHLPIRSAEGLLADFEGAEIDPEATEDEKERIENEIEQQFWASPKPRVVASSEHQSRFDDALSHAPFIAPKV